MIFFANSCSSEKQGNASSRSWYRLSRSWQVLHEQSSIRLDSARQSGLLTVPHHDRDIILTIVTVLTIDHHDRDSLWGRFWGAHDRSSRSWPYPSSSWPSKIFGFLIGLSLVWFWFILEVLFSVLGRYIFGIKAGIKSKIWDFEGWKMCWMLCILIDMWSFVLNQGV